MPRLTRAAHGVAALAAAVFAAACSSDDLLSTENTNNPNRGDVLRLARDVEGLAGTLYQSIHAAHFGGNDNLDNQLKTSSFENASALGNFGMGLRGSLPRSFADNQIGNTTQVGNRRDYNALVTAAGTAATVLEKLYTTGFTLGNTQQDARARSFTWFGYAVALGDVALAYDSSAIPRIGITNVDSLPLANYDSVMRVAIRSLDSAVVYAQTSSAIPTTWLRSDAELTAGASGPYTRLLRSYRARFRANVARSATDRAAVAWDSVIADATTGITTNFQINTAPASGWDYGWLVQHFVGVSWHQMTPYIIGMADSTLAYDAWLATPRDSRNQFLIQTRDARFPRGATRAAQQAQAPQTNQFANLDTLQYFRNRPADDAGGITWINSQYDHNRWRALFNNARVGKWTVFPKGENDMLAAEGYIRRGNVPAATALIDLTRTRNSLPALTGVVTATGQAVPGGQACVPRVPDAARGYTATKCGDVFEAMKWEKRMETAYAGWSQWYFDSRGWNDLPPGTPLMFPVPYQELQARVKDIYSLGGVGSTTGAPNTNTYGFGTTGNL